MIRAYARCPSIPEETCTVKRRLSLTRRLSTVVVSDWQAAALRDRDGDLQNLAELRVTFAEPRGTLQNFAELCRFLRTLAEL